MKIDIIGNTKKNVIFGAISRGLMMVFPFLNRTLFLWLLGPEYLGLNGLFGSILGVLSIAELGFGPAVVCSMYKFIADDDKESMCSCLNFYRRIYHCVGGVILLCGLIIMPFLRKLIHGDIPDGINLYLLYGIHLANTVLSYFLFAYKGALLSAYQRGDITEKIRSLILILQYVTTFLILLLTKNYYLYVFSAIIFTAANNFITAHAVKRLFPDIQPRGTIDKSLRTRIVSDVLSIFFNKIGATISAFADNLVISSILGLVAVAAYGNYFYTYTAVGGFIYVFHSSIAGGFGNSIHTESVEKNFDFFMKANQIALLMVSWCCAVMLALLQPFIRLWTHNDPTLVQHGLTALFMVLYFYVNFSREMLLTFKQSAGLWKQDRFKSLTAAIVNLILNLSLIKYIGLDGVILSTVISFAFIELPWEAAVTFKYYFNADPENLKHNFARKYWMSQLYFALTAGIVCIVTWRVARFVPEKGFLEFILKGMVAAIVATVGVFAFHGKKILQYASGYLKLGRKQNDGAAI